MAARDLILHNIWWKLLALLLAALSWLYIDTLIKRDQTQAVQSPVITSSHRTFPAVPITLMSSANNPDQFRVNPPTADVELSGSAEGLEKLDPQKLVVFVDVTKLPEERQVRRQIQIHLPKDFGLVSVNPTEASVERIATP